ncbi:MAG TPA: hypothetical protein ENG35_00910 [Desulfobacteraceae bacterium]|nr:hypothetical protein [Desulfobacteraceae bacterium]
MNKDIRRRYVGSCYEIDAESKKPQFDITSIILRMILFDTFILQSNNLDEFEILVNSFGYGGVKEILSSGALRIHSEAHAVGQTGQTGLGFRGKKKDGTPKDLLPLNSFSFDVIMHADSKKIMHRNMQKIHNISNIQHKEAIKLKRLIADNLVFYPKESTIYILNQMLNDLKNNTPNIKKAIISSAKKQLNISSLPSEKLSYEIEVDDENDVHVNSNLSQMLGIDGNDAHKILEKALLAIGGLNKRIETMRSFSAVTGFRENELSIFEDKLEFLSASISPDDKEKHLSNVLSWPIFPELSTAIADKKLNIDTLLKVRESPECQEFRSWLWDCDSLETEELKDRINSISAKLSLKLSGKTSKAIRWLSTTGAGFLPVVGVVAGPVLGFLDTFLLEKMLPKSGVLTFLGKQYPTIFKGT